MMLSMCSLSVILLLGCGNGCALGMINVAPNCFSSLILIANTMMGDKRIHMLFLHCPTRFRGAYGKLEMILLSRRREAVDNA